MKQNMWIGASKEEYQQLQLDSQKITIKEDGRHINGVGEEYEWWYLDAELDGGASLVVIFHYRDYASKTRMPKVEFRYNKGDFKIEEIFTTNEASASQDKCDVLIGKNYFRGDLNEYEIHCENNDFNATITLSSLTKPWRPETGHIFFGEEKKYFAWIPSIPHGKVAGTIEYKGQKFNIKGFGYHDHNWGNTSLLKLLSYWYWGRAHVGDYDIISSSIYGKTKYQSKEIIIFMVQHKGKVITMEDATYRKFITEDIVYDEATKKNYANKLIFQYDDGTTKIVITYIKDKILLHKFPLNDMNPFLRSIAHIMGLFPTYTRFTGKCKIDIYEKAKLKVSETSTAIWEQMSFGKQTHK